MIIGILFNDDYICTLKVIIHLLFRNFINYEGKSVVTELFVFTIRCKRRFDGFPTQQSNVVTN